MTTEPPEEATGRRAPRRGIARAATLLIGLTAVSQVLGFVRAGTEQVVAVPAPGFDAGPRPTLALVRARMPRVALAGRLPPAGGATGGGAGGLTGEVVEESAAA